MGLIPDETGAAPDSEMEGYARHIIADLHDISERLGRLESLVAEFVPQARAWASLAKFKRIGGGGRG